MFFMNVSADAFTSAEKSAQSVGWDHGTLWERGISPTNIIHWKRAFNIVLCVRNKAGDCIEVSPERFARYMEFHHHAEGWKRQAGESHLAMLMRIMGNRGADNALWVQEGTSFPRAEGNGYFWLRYEYSPGITDAAKGWVPAV